MDPTFWEPAVRDLVGGRSVLLAGGVAASWTPVVELCRRLGATDVMVLATEGLGAGPQPAAPVIEVPHPDGLTMIESVRQAVAGLVDVPAEVVAAIDAWDPDRTAVVLAFFLNEAPVIAGRPATAWRRPEWLALDDKVVVDALFDRAGLAGAGRRLAIGSVGVGGATGASITTAGAIGASVVVVVTWGSVWSGRAPSVAFPPEPPPAMRRPPAMSAGTAAAAPAISSGRRDRLLGSRPVGPIGSTGISYPAVSIRSPQTPSVCWSECPPSGRP